LRQPKGGGQKREGGTFPKKKPTKLKRLAAKTPGFVPLFEMAS